jgi:hypothetical protein
MAERWLWTGPMLRPTVYGLERTGDDADAA